MSNLDPRRLGRMTASIAPKVLTYPDGSPISPYGNAVDAYHEITQGPNLDSGNAGTELGTFLEPSLVRWAVGEYTNPKPQRAEGIGGSLLGRESDAYWFSAQEFRESARNPLVCATLDALSSDGKTAIEAKLVDDPRMVDQLGEEDDDLPLSVLTQVLVQQFVVESIEVTLVPVAIWRTKVVKLYRVPRNEEQIAMVMDPLSEWIEKHLVRKEPVAGADMIPMSYLRHMRREPGSRVPLDPQLVKVYRDTSEKLSKATKLHDLSKQLIVNALKDGDTYVEAGIVPGMMPVTYYERRNPGPDVKAMRADGIDVDKYIGTHRHLYVPRAKELAT